MGPNCLASFSAHPDKTEPELLALIDAGLPFRSPASLPEPFSQLDGFELTRRDFFEECGIWPVQGGDSHPILPLDAPGVNGWIGDGNEVRPAVGEAAGSGDPHQQARSGNPTKNHLKSFLENMLQPNLPVIRRSGFAFRSENLQRLHRFCRSFCRNRPMKRME